MQSVSDALCFYPPETMQVLVSVPAQKHVNRGAVGTIMVTGDQMCCRIVFVSGSCTVDEHERKP
jgi:hypothetical protein